VIVSRTFEGRRPIQGLAGSSNAGNKATTQGEQLQ